MSHPDVVDGDADISIRLVQLGSLWGWPVFFGAVSLIVGVIALIWPGETLVVLAVLFGIQLIVHGIFRLVTALTMGEATGGARALWAVLGILSLLIGIYAVRHTVITLVALALVLGLFWILDGVALIFSAVEQRDSPVRGLLWFVGILAVAAGVVLVAWPQISLTVLAVVAGVWLIVHGLLQVVIGLQLRKSEGVVGASAAV